MLRVQDQAEGLRAAKNESSRVELLRRSGGSRTRSLAVTSGKGGVGKTQIAANIAVAMAKTGMRVLLLDADLGLASLDLALGLKPENDLLQVINGECDIEEIMVEGPAGVQLLPACPGRYEMANLGPRERATLANAVAKVADQFHILIIDTGAGINSNAVEFASSADEVLLVSTPDPTSLRDAYAMAKVLHKRTGVERIQLVANQVASEQEGIELHNRIDSIVKRFLDLDLAYLGCVPRDESVRQAVAAGEPFVLRSPRSIATRAMEGIVRRLTETTSPRELC